MANSLHRDIQPGEFVVLREDLFRLKFQAQPYRVVQVFTGFGMRSFTMGRALGTHCPYDGEDFRWNGEDIDPEETATYQAELEQTSAPWADAPETPVCDNPRLHARLFQQEKITRLIQYLTHLRREYDDPNYNALGRLNLVGAAGECVLNPAHLRLILVALEGMLNGAQ